MFDNAMRLIADNYWKDAKFNGYDVQVYVESSFKNPSPYNDFDKVHDLITGPYRHCTSEPIITKEAWSELRERNFKWPNPVPSEEHHGHFKTFV